MVETHRSLHTGVWQGKRPKEKRPQAFGFLGSPFWEPRCILHQPKKTPLPGVVLRGVGFEPIFHKWTRELYQGFQLQVAHRRDFEPYFTTLALLSVIRRLYPSQFAWPQPPYEYQTESLPIDLLTGDALIGRASTPTGRMQIGKLPGNPTSMASSKRGGSSGCIAKGNYRDREGRDTISQD